MECNGMSMFRGHHRLPPSWCTLLLFWLLQFAIIHDLHQAYAQEAPSFSNATVSMFAPMSTPTRAGRYCILTLPAPAGFDPHKADADEWGNVALGFEKQKRPSEFLISRFDKMTDNVRAVLFSRAFQLKKLYAESRFDEAANLARDLIRQYGLRPMYKEIDDYERDTYLADVTISNSIVMWGHIAAIERDRRSGRDWALTFSHYLDDRPNLEPTLGLWHMTGWDQKVLLKGAEQALGASSDTVAAAWRDGDDGYIVINGRFRHTMRVKVDDPGESYGGGPNGPDHGGPNGPAGPNGPNPNGGPNPSGPNGPGGGGSGFGKFSKSARLLSAELAAADFAKAAYEGFVDRQLTAHSSDSMMLYDVRQRADGGVSLIFPQTDAAGRVDLAMVDLSPNDVTRLLKGERLSGIDLFGTLVSAANGRAVVQFTDPFGAKAG
jgi:hypothetical protein